MSESKVQPADYSSQSETILSIDDVSVSFSMERGHSNVVDNVSISIERGEIVGIVGESGSGKSMFANALLDSVVEPGVTTGDITYYPDDDDPIDVLSLDKDGLREYRWEEVAMVDQGAMDSFNPTMSIEEHFRETIIAHDQNLRDGMEHARDLLSELYLDPVRVLDSYPHELSGGMQQRTLIALGMVLRPDVLVMDEPTGALDLLMQRSITHLISQLRDRYGISVIFITHDLPLVAGLADRLAVMYAFQFVEFGPTDRVLKDAAHPYTRSLLKAVPNTMTPLEDMKPIEGDSPDPINVPTGCSYHPRCPLATDECRTNEPGFFDVDEEHRAACFHWEDSSDAIPYELSVEEGRDERNRERVAPTSADGEPVIELDDVEVHFEEGGLLQKLFGEQTTVHAVDGVSLEISENDVIALVGESGCGKTTLGKVATGFQRPTGGSVKYRGQDIWETKAIRGDSDIPFEEIREALQIIHQHPGSSLNPNRTVLSILKVPLKMTSPGLDIDAMEQRVYQLLEYLGMKPPEDYANRYPHQLSGGEQQRVALGRALLMSPDVILADEAVSALDVSLRVEMMDLMHNLQDVFDTSFVFVSHDFANARYFTQKAGGKIGVMYLGELVEFGPAEEVIRNPQHPYTKVLSWATPVLDPDLAAEETMDPPVRDIDIPDPIDPPSGCRFHTRCPEAREVCRQKRPQLYDSETSSVAACFRMEEQHEYWNSDPIEIDETERER